MAEFSNLNCSFRQKTLTSSKILFTKLFFWMTLHHWRQKTSVFAKFWEMRIRWMGLPSWCTIRERKTCRCVHRLRCHPANGLKASFGKFVAVCLCSNLIDANEKRDVVDRILSAPKGQLIPVESTWLSDVVLKDSPMTNRPNSTCRDHI